MINVFHSQKIAFQVHLQTILLSNASYAIIHHELQLIKLHAFRNQSIVKMEILQTI